MGYVSRLGVRLVARNLPTFPTLLLGILAGSFPVMLSLCLPPMSPEGGKRAGGDRPGGEALRRVAAVCSQDGCGHGGRDGPWHPGWLSRPISLMGVLGYRWGEVRELYLDSATLAVAVSLALKAQE